MLSLTHAAAGAFVGEFMPNPYVAFVAGVAIHLVMDKIPHFWPKNNRGKSIVIFADTLLIFLFLCSLYLFPATRTVSVFAGALGGVSIDLILVVVMRSKGKWARWHTDRQPHRVEPIWLLTDIFFFTGLVLLIWLAR